MAMQVLHLADSHIWADLPRRRRHARPRRGDDFIVSYRRVLQLAYEHRVDAVVHAGDVFDSPRPTTDAVWAATEPLRALAENGIPVVVIPGNHERSVLPESLLLHHPLISVLDRPRTVRIETDNGVLAVSGLPYLRRPTRAEFVSAIEATGWREHSADARILVTHQAFDTAVCGPQHYRFRKGGDDVVTRGDVPSAFDYVAAGHIHRQQRLKPSRRLRPEIVYAGSPDRITYAEIGEPKGAMLVSFDGGHPQHRFIEHDVRPMSIHPLAVSGWSRTQLLDAVEATVRDVPQGAVAQIRLTGVTDPQALVRLNLPARAFAWREDVIFSYTVRGVELTKDEQHNALPLNASSRCAKGASSSVTVGSCKLSTTVEIERLCRTPEKDAGIRLQSATPATSRRLPSTCGIYLFYDESDRLVYVGKANNLRSRVQSHFRVSAGNFFAHWARQVRSIRAMQLPDEQSALELESRIIEVARPAFNIAGRIPAGGGIT